MRVFKDFIDNFRNITTPNKGQLNDGGDETRRESIFKVAVAFEEFAFNYGKYHLNERILLQRSQAKQWVS